MIEIVAILARQCGHVLPDQALLADAHRARPLPRSCGKFVPAIQ